MSITASARTRLVGLALVAGIVTAMLLWHASIGASWLVLVVLACGLVLGGLDRQRPTALAWCWAAITVWLAACLVWRASAWTLAFALPSSVAMLAALPLVVRHRATWRELGDVPALMVAWLVGGPRASGEAIRCVAAAEGPTKRRLFGGLLLGLPVSLVTALLLSANPRFRAAADAIFANSSDVVGFAVFALVAAGIWLVGYLALDRIDGRVFAWVRDPALLGRVVRLGAVRTDDSPYRAIEATRVVDRVPRQLAPLTWLVVLAQLSAVFALNVVANLSELFGGHELVRQSGTATYAEYLHAGFAEVTMATLLSVAVVIVGQRIVATPSNRAHSYVLAALEVVLLALTAITLGSCWQRMSIYLDAYGTTHQRIAVIVFQVAVLGLLLLTVARAVHRTWRGWAAAVVGWGVAVLVGASTLDADLIVARVNLQRLVDAPQTATSTGLDAEYLATLSTDALPALDDPHVPPELAEYLRARWLHADAMQADAGWRSRRGLSVLIDPR